MRMLPESQAKSTVLARNLRGKTFRREVMRKTLVFLALSALGALPALAQEDVAAMTCGAFYAMDAAGQETSINAIVNFVNDSANAAQYAVAAEAITGAGEGANGVRAIIDKGCEGQTVDTNLLSVIK
jgi:hypothetical protein